MAGWGIQHSMKRALLKLSGEAFGRAGLERESLEYVVAELEAALSLEVELGVVVGGGNLVRGRDLPQMDRAAADQMGMLATVINGLALQEALGRRGVPAVLQSAVAVPWADPVHPRRAREALSQNRIVIFAGGTGNPFVTTDTAAAIRAAEIGAEGLLKATDVDGVYTADPKHDPAAQRLPSLTYEQVLRERLEVMDLAALALCEQYDIPIVVFDFFQEGNLRKVLEGEEIGTRVSGA